jgi:hypothetical protein
MTARSRIHISFNLWTSPNSKELIKVVFHFLNKDLKMRSLLAKIKRIKGSYTGENITEAVILIIEAIINSN